MLTLFFFCFINGVLGTIEETTAQETTTIGLLTMIGIAGVALVLGSLTGYTHREEE